MKTAYVITIDGPSAAGKGTIAKLLAERLGAIYIPSGNIYRALAKLMQDNATKPDDVQAICVLSDQIKTDDIYSADLNNEEIASTASKMAAYAQVRDTVSLILHKLAKQHKKIIAEGRDMGSVVFQNADLKIFITANLESRAIRRYKELQERGIKVIYEQLVDDLKKRDERDASRVNSPLIVPANAFVVDSSKMTIQETLDYVVELVEKM